MNIMLNRMRAGIRRIINTDPDIMELRGQKITYAYANANGGNVGEAAGNAMLYLNETPYIFAVGEVDWQEGDIFERRGRFYQIGAVSIDGSTDGALAGGVVSTTAQVREVVQ